MLSIADAVGTLQTVADIDDVRSVRYNFSTAGKMGIKWRHKPGMRPVVSSVVPGSLAADMDPPLRPGMALDHLSVKGRKPLYVQDMPYSEMIKIVSVHSSFTPPTPLQPLIRRRVGRSLPLETKWMAFIRIILYVCCLPRTSQMKHAGRPMLLTFAMDCEADIHHMTEQHMDQDNDAPPPLPRPETLALPPKKFDPLTALAPFVPGKHSKEEAEEFQGFIASGSIDEEDLRAACTEAGIDPSDYSAEQLGQILFYFFEQYANPLPALMAGKYSTQDAQENLDLLPDLEMDDMRAVCEEDGIAVRETATADQLRLLLKRYFSQWV